MNNLNLIDYLFLYSIILIWITLMYQVLLSYSGFIYFLKSNNKRFDILDKIHNFTQWPSVSVLIPAHNEEKVILKTVNSMLNLNYPSDKIEIIVINDNSQDNTKDILLDISNSTNKNLKIINTTPLNGGKGKSNALNIGLKSSNSDFIAVYDADNTPNSMALKYLIYTILSNDTYAAVIGKFRTRNKSRNLLTKFINIETLSFQWLSQGGRWFLFNLATIPGTNFVIRKNILDELNGWDDNAIAEDTEISIRIYQMGYKICFMPLAITWEQEPETLKVWFNQRLRWVKGNLYVVHKYIPKIFKIKKLKLSLDLIYFFSTYVLFLSSIIISDIIFILGILSTIFNYSSLKISIEGNFLVIWLMAYILFILEISVVLTFEKGENKIKNILYICIMYFTYCQLWILLGLKGLYEYTKDLIFKKEVKWNKTQRF